MIRFAPLLLLLLAACTPSVRQAAQDETLSVRDGALVLQMASPIVSFEGAVKGTIVCTSPVVCAPLSGPWVGVSLPTGQYPARVVLGRVEKPPGDAFGFVNLASGRKSVQVELTP